VDSGARWKIRGDRTVEGVAAAKRSGAQLREPCYRSGNFLGSDSISSHTNFLSSHVCKVLSSLRLS
jgi:hypothetical protein